MTLEGAAHSVLIPDEHLTCEVCHEPILDWRMIGYSQGAPVHASHPNLRMNNPRETEE